MAAYTLKPLSEGVVEVDDGLIIGVQANIDAIWRNIDANCNLVMNLYPPFLG